MLDEQHLQELLESEQANDSFTSLCRFFGGGGCPAFWAAARIHDWESAVILCDYEPVVPQRTRNWLNKHADCDPPLPEVV
jgi:hypothetical protein